MDKQAYLKTVSQAAFRDEFEKIGGKSNVFKTIGSSFGNVASAITGKRKINPHLDIKLTGKERVDALKRSKAAIGLSAVVAANAIEAGVAGKNWIDKKNHGPKK